MRLKETQWEQTLFKSWHYAFRHQRAKCRQLNPSIMILLSSQQTGPVCRDVGVWHGHTHFNSNLPISLSLINTCPRTVQLCCVVSFCNKKQQATWNPPAWYYRLCVCVCVRMWALMIPQARNAEPWLKAEHLILRLMGQWRISVSVSSWM